ncbi:MAG: adenylosuccinate lyase [Candidatus Marinimicrobia bacterium]|nr:adenylosuccinate lyase [Candidatus Neomarinimicrobiota bacterium]
MLDNLSPIDGRYKKDTQELKLFFSEEALIKYRIKIEIEYLIALCSVVRIKELKPLSSAKKTELRYIYNKFSTNDAKQVKNIEGKTNHDVKAIEYFISDKLNQSGSPKLIPWIHFALTSEDINNLAYSLMWQDGLIHIYLPTLKKFIANLKTLAKKYNSNSMLAMTHGQPATPTTIGKELAVFCTRLQRQTEYINGHKLQGKFGGATGTWGAHIAAHPNVDWLKFSRKFIKSLKLEPNLITTQIESHDSVVESYQSIIRVNSILIDFCQDIWQYISRGIFKQKRIADEVGSSTMPHKINPINFENAEGNLGISNALLTHFCTKLPISRLQRDLSDSTVLRNQGVAMAHSLLAIKNIIKGLNRLAVNKDKTLEELNSHWEVLAEAIQTILRRNGQLDAYEKLKELTHGEKMSRETINKFINGLVLPKADKKYLLSLTPETYTGLSSKLAGLV